MYLLITQYAMLENDEHNKTRNRVIHWGRPRAPYHCRDVLYIYHLCLDIFLSCRQRQMSSRLRYKYSLSLLAPAMIWFRRENRAVGVDLNIKCRRAANERRSTMYDDSDAFAHVSSHSQNLEQGQTFHVSVRVT